MGMERDFNLKKKGLGAIFIFLVFFIPFRSYSSVSWEYMRQQVLLFLLLVVFGLVLQKVSKGLIFASKVWSEWIFPKRCFPRGLYLCFSTLMTLSCVNLKVPEFPNQPYVLKLVLMFNLANVSQPRQTMFVSGKHGNYN